jgi:hypothetical protein
VGIYSNGPGISEEHASVCCYQAEMEIEQVGFLVDG